MGKAVAGKLDDSGFAPIDGTLDELSVPCGCRKASGHNQRVIATYTAIPLCSSLAQ